MGIILDEHLSWKAHVAMITGKLSKINEILNRLKYIYSAQVLITLYRVCQKKKDILNIHIKSEGITIFPQKFNHIDFTIFMIINCQNFIYKLCSEQSRHVLHVRILLLIRYSQWTRTVTELPTVKGFTTNCNGV